MEDDFVKNFKLIQINETFAPNDPVTEEFRELDDEVERILNQPEDELLAEVEQLPGGVEGHVKDMRKLIKEAVDKANQDWSR